MFLAILVFAFLASLLHFYGIVAFALGMILGARNDMTGRVAAPLVVGLTTWLVQVPLRDSMMAGDLGPPLIGIATGALCLFGVFLGLFVPR